MTQEALKLALEALKWCHGGEPCGTAEAITVVEKALAQEQEPVAWVLEDVCEGQYIDGRPRKIWWECEKGVGTAFYTHPPQRTEQNFCSRCGKRTKDIHTCTPPMEMNT